MYNNNKCVSCKKLINPDIDDHAICNICNVLMCEDDNSCIRDHMEYSHSCGYTLRSPVAERRRMKRKLKGITPEFVIDDPIVGSKKL